MSKGQDKECSLPWWVLTGHQNKFSLIKHYWSSLDLKCVLADISTYIPDICFKEQLSLGTCKQPASHYNMAETSV